MELCDLELGLKHLSSQGYTLNVQEIAMLNANLNKLQAEEKFGKIFFWGKIFGKGRDYFIAYGLRDQNVEFPSKQFYCATDEKFEFADLPVLTDDDAAKISTFAQDTAFSGEPDSLLFTPVDDDEGAEPEFLTELHRVAYTIQSLNHDTSVVPVDAYVLNDAHQVVEAPDYKGLQYASLSDLASYAHFRPAENVGKLRAMAKDDVDWKNGNFLDRLTSSLPKKSWATRLDAGSSSVHLRSLLWPGYAFYAVAQKSYHGSIYIGHGIRNNDLAFLM